MKTLKLLLVLLLSSGFISGCFEDEDHRYDGPVVIEFAPTPGTSGGNGAKVRTVTIPAANNGTVNVAVKVQLVGPWQSSDANVPFEVSGTAVRGTNYEINGNAVTIPANSSSADINIAVNGGSLTPGQSRTIILTLTNGGTFAPSENYKTYTVTIAKSAS